MGWMVPGVCDPGLSDGYAPHTSIMRILRMRMNTIHIGVCLPGTNRDEEVRISSER
ncbi:MAG: hypothetical protein M0Q48_10265 [Verrucomicrobia bacterium]|nr:hypothetical protein [Verrucomicrobiota bacterium]